MKIGVVGLGLIGGSIFRDLNALQKYEVIGISQSQKGENITNDYICLKTCDIVFVCKPMNKTLSVLDELNGILPKNTIVTDVCSLKRFVSNKKYNFNFIPSHPMAGTEKQGFENSFEGLFKGAKWVITPINSSDNTEILESIVKDLGAIPVYTTPDKHDKAVALISHLPMVISQALFKNAADNNLALNIASSGFRDTTRLAMSNVEMAQDMVTMNADNIEETLLSLYRVLGELLSPSYKDEITKIKSQREKMFK